MSKYGGDVWNIPREVKPSTSEVGTIKSQLSMTKDPAMRQRLALQAALEARYAQDMAVAQNKVQAAALAPFANVIYGSPAQTLAAMERKRLAQEAAARYNSALPLGSDYAMRKDITRWDL